MSIEDGWPGNPRCICPPITFTGGPTAEEVAECRRKAYPIDPHPVLTEENMRACIAQLREQLARPYRA